MSDPIENAKRRYSEELAAYTLEQWRLARSALQAAQNSVSSPTESEESNARSEAGTRRRSRSRSHSTDLESQVEQDLARSFRAIDFAQKAPPVNGTA